MNKSEKQVVKSVIKLLKTGKLRHYSSNAFQAISGEIKVIITDNAMWVTYGNHESTVIKSTGFLSWKLQRTTDKNVEQFPSVGLSRLAIELGIHGKGTEIAYKIGIGCEPTQNPSVVLHTESGRYISVNHHQDYKDTFKLSRHNFQELSDIMVFNSLGADND